MKLPDKVYDALKWTTLIALPAVSIAYIGLASIWTLPFADEVPKTFGVLILLMGSLLGLSTVSYNKTTVNGSLEVNTTDDTQPMYTLNVGDADVTTLASKTALNLKVTPKE